jgi:hypothetical protein
VWDVNLANVAIASTYFSFSFALPFLPLRLFEFNGDHACGGLALTTGFTSGWADDLYPRSVY